MTRADVPPAFITPGVAMIQSGILALRLRFLRKFRLMNPRSNHRFLGRVFHHWTALAGLSFAGTLTAQVVLVDFNKLGPTPSGNWNSIALTDQNLALVDSAGAASGIYLSHNFVAGLGVTGVPYNGGDASWYDDAVAKDGWKIGATSRQVTFSGFTDGVPVTFSVIAARGSGAAGATESLSLSGASSLSIASNIAPYGDGLSTDGSTLTLYGGSVMPSAGVISLLISGTSEATINGLRFEVSAVPEVEHMAWVVGLTVLGYGVRRRCG